MKFEYPPLQSVTIQFVFPSFKSLTIDQLSALVQEIRNEYPKKPEILLIQSKPQVQFSFQITPMTFLSRDGTNILQLFSDRLVFRYTEYKSWEETRNAIIDILSKTTKVINIEDLSLDTVEYVDLYNFESENFKISEYFTLFPSYSPSWKLNFEDFHLGANISIENEDTFIIRLRGVPSDDENRFRFLLEHLYRSRENLISKDNLREIQNKLDEVHQIISKHFYSIMREKTLKIIGEYSE